MSLGHGTIGTMGLPLLDCGIGSLRDGAARREGTAKVADVGLAHVVHASHIAELDALGTFAYAAPELINGDKCNEKADIWCVCG